MKLYDELPNSVTLDGRRFKLDLDFRNVLRMMETMSRNDLLPESRAYLSVKCVCKRPKNATALLYAIQEMLFPESKFDEEYHEKITDFVHDAALIRAAFRQAYRIDLYRDRLHWIEFSELLNAIPEGNRYSEVVGIRARPIPAPTKWNQQEREWLMKAKMDVALPVSEDERMRKYHADVGKIFAGLIGMIERGKNGE